MPNVVLMLPHVSETALTCRGRGTEPPVYPVVSGTRVFGPFGYLRLRGHWSWPVSMHPVDAWLAWDLGSLEDRPWAWCPWGLAHVKLAFTWTSVPEIPQQNATFITSWLIVFTSSNSGFNVLSDWCMSWVLLALNITYLQNFRSCVKEQCFWLL